MRLDGDGSHIGFTFGQRTEQFRIVLRDGDDGVLFAFYNGVTANVAEAIIAFEHWTENIRNSDRSAVWMPGLLAVLATFSAAPTKLAAGDGTNDVG